MMTREEIIKEYEASVAAHAAAPAAGIKGAGKSYELFKAGLDALRPVSREQVEKVWRGEWNNINPAVLKPGVSWVCRCAKCGCPQDYKHNFCPNCGAAQTDEAVDMVMERLEALNDAVSTTT